MIKTKTTDDLLLLPPDMSEEFLPEKLSDKQLFAALDAEWWKANRIADQNLWNAMALQEMGHFTVGAGYGAVWDDYGGDLADPDNLFASDSYDPLTDEFTETTVGKLLDQVYARKLVYIRPDGETYGR